METETGWWKMIFRHLRCMTCNKRITQTCKTINTGRPADFRGISLYTRINGCPNHSDAHTLKSEHVVDSGQTSDVNRLEPIVIGAEKLSENGYRVWYQPYKNNKATGMQHKVLLTRNEFELTMLREVLIYEYNVPVDVVDNLISTAQLVNKDELEDRVSYVIWQNKIYCGKKLELEHGVKT